MADISPTRQNIRSPGVAYAYVWANLTENDTAVGKKCPGLNDKTVQVLGDFGSGGTIVIEGSLVEEPGASDWTGLTDPQGNALSFTAAGLEAIQENVVWVRARVSAGTSVDVNVYLLGS